jgi:NitT/TauT family transport system substrate-binding protein
VITLRKSGIDTPEKLRGHKIAWFQALVEGLLDPVIEAGGLSRKDVQLVTVARGAEVQMLAAGQVDALFGYSFGQALTLEHRGFPVNVMPIRDYGVQFYGTVIYTSEALLKSNPDLVTRFLRASVKGFIYAHDHPEDAVKETLLAAPDREVPLETDKLRIIFRLYNVPDYAERFGRMTDAKWQSSIALLARGGDLARTPAASEMYTNAVLDQLPESQTLATLIKTPAR